MLFENLLILSKNLSFGMIITYLLRYFEIEVSSDTVFAPSVNIDRTLLKRMQAEFHERAQVPQAPP